MTTILGISALYHDAAAALVTDGRIVAAAQEERFTRKKHDASMPFNAATYCLSEAGIGPSDIDIVAFYDKPILKFERLLETYTRHAPRGFRSFSKAMPVWGKTKLHVPREVKRILPSWDSELVFAEHHESHAASAFYPSPFDQAAILTADGVGEWATTTLGTGNGNRIVLDLQIDFPHSLGLLYSAFTYHAGFKVNSGEYKLMGLAPFGDPRFRSTILDNLIDLKADGSFKLNMDYLGYEVGLRMTNARFDALFGERRRLPESEIRQFDMDMAASVQSVIEEAMLRLASTARSTTGMRSLCLAGGVALNCVANGKVRESGLFESIWIQPAAGDAGGALGAALLVWHQLLDEKRTTSTNDGQDGSLLGPGYTKRQIEEELRDRRAVISAECADEEDLCEYVAHLLAEGKIVGWFQGRMEYGPRALGSRSILADPRSSNMQRDLNLKIKFRESFRPFAPAVLRSHASDYFEMSENENSPYMLDVFRVRGARADRDTRGLDRLNTVESPIPAVTHVDGSARVQTVERRDSARFHRLLNSFFSVTGCPVLVNTSFNVRGEPIVRSPAEAFDCFMATEMDALAIGDFVLLKTDQTTDDGSHQKRHLERFDLD